MAQTSKSGALPPQRTIIELLRKGNQELFHSTMVAWLLDPLLEHGKGTAILDFLAQALSSRGYPALQDAFRAAKEIVVGTEEKGSKSRYDITVRLGVQKFLIENKTKSIGTHGQLATYQDAGWHLIALGLDEVCFPPATDTRMPLLTYRDVWAAMDAAGPGATDAFGVLYDQYQAFLGRELALLRDVVAHFRDGDDARLDGLTERLAQIDERRRNERRFLHLYYLASFVHYLDERGQLQGADYSSSKDMISGVWIAFAPPPVGTLHPELEALKERYQARLWFHIELLDFGGFFEPRASWAGEFQLRCELPTDGNGFRGAFGELGLTPPEEFPSRAVSRSARTLCLARRRFTYADLDFASLAQLFTGFQRRYHRTTGLEGGLS